MKNIYINGRFLSQRVTGVQRFAREVTSALDNLQESALSELKGKVYLVAPQGDFTLPSLSHIELIQNGRSHGHLWEQIELPRLARGGLLFNPCGPAPFFHPLQVTVLHDAAIYAAPAGYSWQFRMWHKILNWRTSQNARLLFTVSNFSKDQLTKYCGVPEERIRVVSPSGNHILNASADPSVLARYGLAEQVPYVFSVGSRQANKNFRIFAEVAEILRDSPVRFLVVGSTNSSVFRGAITHDQNMTFTDFISDGELRSVYEHAMCFVFPSLYEGFGIPPLEAMACGCPVLASNATSIPEACGDAALYFDPLNAQTLANSITKALYDPEILSSLRELGRARAGQTTWTATAAAIGKELIKVASTGQ